MYQIILILIISYIIQGEAESADNRIFLIDKEDLKNILEKVNKINEKYGIPKRWRAEYERQYLTILSNGKIEKIRDYGNIDDNLRYSLGNYFKTREEAQRVIDNKEWQEFWAKVRAGEIGND